jgi:hypothetical protein
MSAKVYDFGVEKAHREKDQQELLKEYPVVECFKCEGEARPVQVFADDAVAYCCPGYGHHRKFHWRFNKSGEMMYGLKGNRYYW